VCVVVRRTMIVERSSQVKRVRRQSRYARMKGCVKVQISIVVFGFQFQGDCGRLVFRFLFQMEIQENLLRNVFKEVEFLSKGWFCKLIRGMMKSLEISRTTINSSQSVCLG